MHLRASLLRDLRSGIRQSKEAGEADTRVSMSCCAASTSIGTVNRGEPVQEVRVTAAANIAGPRHVDITNTAYTLL